MEKKRIELHFPKDLHYKIYNCEIETVYLTIAQKQLSNSIAKKYCLNQKCINPTKYWCCIGCFREKPCNPKPNLCKIFFCETVLDKMTKKQIKFLGLEELYKKCKTYDIDLKLE